jgi:uncharacterized phiE125 gp8 family phage protein
MTTISVKTEPASEPLSKDDVKLHLGADGSEHDSAFVRLIAGARKKVERTTGRRLITQTLEVFYDNWPRGVFIDFPVAPVQSVTTIKYYDADDVLQTLASSKYTVDVISEPGRIVLNVGETWPTLRDGKPNSVVVELIAGYGTDSSDVDEGIITAMLMMIETSYDRPDQKYMEALERVTTKELSPYKLRRF